MNKVLTVLIVLTCTAYHLKGQNNLPIPPLDIGSWNNGIRTFDLSMQNSSTEFFSGVITPTSGYNGNFLGPTLYMKKGDSLTFNVTNMLGENSTTHWHGLHVPAIMDGGPHQMITDNSTWTATFTMLNTASTFWYHPHHKPDIWTDLDGTGGQVFRGLAGMLIVEDDETDALNLPSTYGVDEIPLIVQDRAFNPDGTFKEFLNFPALVVRTGDTILVNGAITPMFEAPAQMVRFRILNASNGRTYYFGFSDNRNFQQIASDGGLLTAPVALNRLRLAPAERAEIVVDFSGEEGTTLELLSYASELVDIFPVFPPILLDGMDTLDYQIMSFEVGSPTADPITNIPTSLTSIPVYDENDAWNKDDPRLFELQNGSPLMTINGVSMELNVINETIHLGDMEVWEIINRTGVAHPFHVHGAPFQILSRSDGAVPENEKGWKDVVLVPRAQNQNNPGRVKIIKPFLDFADDTFPYMYHCHILEHEDRGMMGQYLVIDTTTTSIESVNEIISDSRLYPNPVEANNVRVEFMTSNGGEFTFALVNQAGQKITTFFVNKQVEIGRHIYNLSLEGIPSGMYFISIKSKQGSIVKKLIKL